MTRDADRPDPARRAIRIRRVRARRARLGLLGDVREGGRVIDGQLGEALAVEADAGGLQAADELAVAQAVERVPRR